MLSHEGQRMGFACLRCPFTFKPIVIESVNRPISIVLIFIVKVCSWLLGTLSHLDFDALKESSI